MSHDEYTGGGRFPATHGSIVEAARSADVSERAHALDVLCTAYWKPVYKYVRLRWNRMAVDAQDLTQGQRDRRESSINFQPAGKVCLFSMTVPQGR